MLELEYVIAFTASYRIEGDGRITRAMPTQPRLYVALHDELTKHLDEVAKTIIEAAVHRDLTDAPEVAEPKQLSMSVGG